MAQIGTVRRNDPGTLLEHLGVEFVAIAGAVADQVLQRRLDHVSVAQPYFVNVIGWTSSDTSAVTGWRNGKTNSPDAPGPFAA